MKLLFLDNDHVLNCGDQHRWPNGYLPLCWPQVEQVNRILAAVPDLQIVVSSAWRYHVHSGRMTVEGLAELYMHFGMDAFGRVLGVTDRDPHHFGDSQVAGWEPDDWHREGLIWRADQIHKARVRFRPERYAVLDDLPLNVEHLFQTDRDRGLTPDIANAILVHFGGKP